MSDLYGIKQIGYLQKGLDARLVKQSVISANIANASTPGYKEKSVDFTSRLEEALGRKTGMAETHPGHLPNHNRGVAGSSPIIGTVEEGGRIDGNTVDLERAATEGSINGTEYTMLITAYNKQSKQLIAAISGGK